ncbi:UDP-N-acetylmuramoyl-L-alanyl-D-glutamate--2,6-diaminopimelate ligase [Shewanella sp. OPT22]|nr:UDP-N-acetylmuramoyl-L-alanyl-D-glutamate--2,6-diaminopimelate ligase [Shewanella sp. OPT22]
MMLIKDLLAPWFHYSGEESVKELQLDSRSITLGDVFVAVPGYEVDGRKFIPSAFEKGANAVLVHTDEPEEHGKVTRSDQGLLIYFFRLNAQLSALAMQRYPVDPTRMTVIGVTGTNGKTTVTQLIAQLSEGIGKTAAVMGTTGNGLWGQLEETVNTTSDAITVMRELHRYQNLGARTCAMEVSSHGLVQHRVDAVPFSTAIMTNLSRDHLDFHGDMRSYSKAKQTLFKFISLNNGLLNFDDETAQSWRFDLKPQIARSFSLKDDINAEFYIEDAQFSNIGVQAQLVWPEGRAQLESPLLGMFNLSNLVAAIAALYLEGADMNLLLEHAKYLKPAMGRMEQYQKDDVAVVVDYAHTPDALEKALQTLRQHCQGDLWCVFGCGGDRDKGKRPIMAAAAESYADNVVLTSDNPRREKPESIIEDVLTGFNEPERITVCVDRVEAIKNSVKQAKQGDIILVAGKGHETYQEIDGVKHDYDERALIARLMEACG